MEHGTGQRLRKMREISEAAAMARSILHKKARQLRASAIQSSQPSPADKSQHILAINGQQTMAEYTEPPMAYKSASFLEDIKQSQSGIHLELRRSSAKSTLLVVEKRL